MSPSKRISLGSWMWLMMRVTKTSGGGPGIPKIDMKSRCHGRVDQEPYAHTRKPSPMVIQFIWIKEFIVPSKNFGKKDGRVTSRYKVSQTWQISILVEVCPLSWLPLKRDSKWNKIIKENPNLGTITMAAFSTRSITNTTTCTQQVGIVTCKFKLKDSCKEWI